MVDIWEKLEHNQISLEEVYKFYKYNIDSYNATYNALVHIEDQVFEDSFVTGVDNPKDSLLRKLPIVIKDSIMTKDIPTTSGAKEFEHYVPTKDSPVIRRVIQDGGVISAKSNTPKYTLDVQTYNQLFGLTRNPYNPDLTTGGSSGGSAAAIRLGMTDLALGTDLAGSLRIPAAFCGISSMKPTFGRISNSGHIPPGPDRWFSGFENTIGPMASSVAGLEQLMRSLSQEPVNGYPKRVFEPKTPADPEGFTLKISSQLDNQVISSEVEKGMNELKSTLDSSDIRFEIDHPDLDFKETYRAHGIFYHLMMQSNDEQTDDKTPRPKQIADAFEIRNSYSNKLESFIGSGNAWILPVCRIQPFEHNLERDSFVIKDESVGYWKATINYTIPFSVMGTPVAVIPVGMVDGLPFGIQIIGHRWKDEELLSIAKTIETIVEGRVKPPSI